MLFVPNVILKCILLWCCLCCFIRFSLSLIEQSVSEVEKPHKRCSGLFSVALSSELDAAIVTKCHGIKICQEFYRECQAYVIPPNPSILPTKRYSWWNLFCIFAASENPVETKIEMKSEIPSMVGHGLQNQNLLYLDALHTNSPQERFYQRHCT